jgi:hypothetical protein
LVILGINKPFVVEVMSKAAEPSGFVVPIPTWAYELAVNNTAAKSVKICFIGLIVYLMVSLVAEFNS